MQSVIFSLLLGASSAFADGASDLVHSLQTAIDKGQRSEIRSLYYSSDPDIPAGKLEMKRWHILLNILKGGGTIYSISYMTIEQYSEDRPVDSVSILKSFERIPISDKWSWVMSLPISGVVSIQYGSSRNRIDGKYREEVVPVGILPSGEYKLIVHILGSNDAQQGAAVNP